MPINIKPMPSPGVIAKIEEVNGHVWRRRAEYEQIAEQLDMLFKDIDAGLFGEPAKTGAFYAHIKAIKDAYPVPADLETLKAELDALIAQEGEQ